jgi:hypothetical protein
MNSDYFVGLFGYSFHCLALPLKTAECFNFWKICFGAILVLLFLFLCAVIGRIFQNKREWNAYQVRLLNRAKIADEEVMKKSRWQGDDFFDKVSESELAEAMRKKINKAQNKT